jgi:hypothetical protein
VVALERHGVTDLVIPAGHHLVGRERLRQELARPRDSLGFE